MTCSIHILIGSIIFPRLKMFGKMYCWPSIFCLNLICVLRSYMAEVCYHGLNSIDRDYFCCDGFERKKGKCVECRTGYTTTNGELCQPCAKGYYGYRCAESCSLCTIFERCDHVQGCIRPTTVNLYTTNDFQEYTDTDFATQYDKATDDFDHTAYPSFDQSQELGADDNPSDLTKLYGLFAGGIFMVILTFSIWMFYHNRKRCRNMNLSGRTAEPSINDNAYEEIDEMALSDLSQSHPTVNNAEEVIEVETSTQISSDSEKSSQSNLECYLNPYQPTIQNTEQRAYKALENNEFSIHNIDLKISETNTTDIDVLESNATEDLNTKKSIAGPIFEGLHYTEIQIEKTPINVKEIVEKYENTQVFPDQSPFQPKTQYAEIIHPERHSVL